MRRCGVVFPGGIFGARGNVIVATFAAVPGVTVRVVT
jgi:hypothetical protein